jgi:sRNA-binding carbon storage regulator CsrA
MALTVTRRVGESVLLADRLEITLDEITEQHIAVLLGARDAEPTHRHVFHHPGETLTLGPVRITTRRDRCWPWQAKLSFEAPRRIQIMRRELVTAGRQR